ncbi:MAG: ATP-binding cassette domain-containing protein [Erysipelotrichaceae bacterium]|nr:ATP-binding cassette domain-containing protein [Erysipelotrichaceae bacterium]
MIKLVDLSKKYGDNTLFKKLNYSFYDGIYLIKGKSGSGKSTLLDIIFGIKNRDGGLVLFNDKEANSLFRNNNISYLKSCLILNNNLSYNENLKSFNFVYNSKKAIQLIDKFQLYSKINKPLYLLSGGERKLFNIIYCLCRDVYCYLIDEPFSEIGEENSKIILEELTALSKNHCVIITNHEQESYFFDYNGIIDLDDNSQISSKETIDSFKPNDKFGDNKLSFKQMTSYCFGTLKQNRFENILFSLFLIISFLCVFIGAETIPLNNSSSLKLSLENEQYQYVEVSKKDADFSSYQGVDSSFFINGVDATLGINNNDYGQFYIQSIEQVGDVKIEDGDIYLNNGSKSMLSTDLSSDFKIIESKKLFNDSDSGSKLIIPKLMKYKYDDYKNYDTLYLNRKTLENLFLNKELFSFKDSKSNNVFGSKFVSYLYIDSTGDFSMPYNINFVENEANYLAIDGYNESDKVVLSLTNIISDFYKEFTITNNHIDSDASNKDIYMSNDVFIKYLFSIGLIRTMVNKNEYSFLNSNDISIINSPLSSLCFDNDIKQTNRIISIIAFCLGAAILITVLCFSIYSIIIKNKNEKDDYLSNLYNFSNKRKALIKSLGSIVSSTIALIASLLISISFSPIMNSILFNKRGWQENNYISLYIFSPNNYENITSSNFAYFKYSSIGALILVIITLIYVFVLLMINFKRLNKND